MTRWITRSFDAHGPAHPVSSPWAVARISAAAGLSPHGQVSPKQLPVSSWETTSEDVFAANLIPPRSSACLRAMNPWFVFLAARCDSRPPQAIVRLLALSSTLPAV